jgi:hypothetical protein
LQISVLVEKRIKRDDCGDADLHVKPTPDVEVRPSQRRRGTDQPATVGAMVRGEDVLFRSTLKEARAPDEDLDACCPG